MDTIFTVVGSYYCDDYNCYDNVVICATTDKDKADKKVVELEKEFVVRKATYEKITNFQNKLYEANPYPSINDDNLLDRPRWPSGLKQHEITDEMKSERLRIQEHNKIEHEKHSLVTAKWQEEHDLAMNQFIIAEFGLTDPIEIYNLKNRSYPDKRSFFVDTLELI